jgi:hypothetical protein
MVKILKHSAGPHFLTKIGTVGKELAGRKWLAGRIFETPQSGGGSCPTPTCIDFPPHDALFTSGVAERTAAVIFPARFVAPLADGGKYL